MDKIRFVNKKIKQYKELLKYYQNLKHEDKYLENRRMDKIIEYKELLKIYIEIKRDLDAWKIITNDSVLGNLIKRMANGKYFNGHLIKKEKREKVKKALKE